MFAISCQPVWSHHNREVGSGGNSMFWEGAGGGGGYDDGGWGEGATGLWPRPSSQ